MEKEVNKNQKGTFTILAVVLSIISLILLGAGFYLFSNSKTILLQSLGKFTNEAKLLIEKSNNTYIQDILVKDKIKVSSDIKFTTNNEELFSLNLSYLDNERDKESSLDFKLSQKSLPLLEGNATLANNNIYLKVKDIMDYYYTEFEYIRLLSEIPTAEYKKVIDIFSESVKDELKDGKINKSKETIKLGEKDKKVTKLSYKITTDNISNIMINTIEEILKDKKLVTSLAATSGISEKEFKEGLTKVKENLKEPKDAYLYYNVYYYGFNNIVMYELADATVSIQLYDYDNTNDFIISQNDKTLFTLKLVEEDDKYTILGKMDTYSYNGTLIEKDNKLSLDLNITVEGMIINLKLDQKTSESDNYQVNTKLILGIMGTEIGMDINTIYADLDKVELNNLDTAKNFSTMTVDELNAIVSNIEKHPFLSSIYELITTYSSTLNSIPDVDPFYETEYQF